MDRQSPTYVGWFVVCGTFVRSQNTKKRRNANATASPAPDEISQLYKDTLRSIVLIIALHYGSLREMHRSDQTWLEA
jgi:hypothetical protein